MFKEILFTLVAVAEIVFGLHLFVQNEQTENPRYEQVASVRRFEMAHDQDVVTYQFRFGTNHGTATCMWDANMPIERTVRDSCKVRVIMESISCEPQKLER